MSPAQPPERATAILVTGVPGSGKTTLARAVAKELRLPDLSRDDVRTGLFFSLGAWGDQPERVPTVEESVDGFLSLAESFLGAGVSCVLEYVVRAEQPEHLARLVALADVRVLVTRCDDPMPRFAERNRADRLLHRPPVLALLGHETNEEHTAAAIPRMAAVAEVMLRDFGDLPVLEVDTTEGYWPDLEAVLAFVTTTSRTSARRPDRSPGPRHT